MSPADADRPLAYADIQQYVVLTGRRRRVSKSLRGVDV